MLAGVAAAPASSACIFARVASNCARIGTACPDNIMKYVTIQSKHNGIVKATDSSADGSLAGLFSDLEQHDTQTGHSVHIGI